MTNLSNKDSTRNITVAIEKVQNATIIEGNNFFEEELKLAIDLINYILKHRNMDDEKNNRDKENNWFHQHNTIAVLGPRGIGKTSFILTLRDIIENYSKYSKKDETFEKKYEGCKGLDKKIIWLPNLDPTRMEENETFLVTVVANILKTISKNNDLDFNIREGLQSLGRDFLVLVSARVHEEQWKDLVDDPDSFAYNVLSNAHSGISLARSFHEFLGTCIKTLGKGEEHAVFVQPIDDVDTAIEQGWPILETIRKYLATPHLITIVTGDIDLYETLVRKQQLDKLSDLLKNESNIGGNFRKIGDQIAQLTEQYLAKVIPSHLRIRLKPIAPYITQKASSKEDGFVYLEFDDDDEKKAIQSLSKIYVNFDQALFGIKNKDFSSLDPISGANRLFPYITRDLVRFFKVLKPWYDAENKKQKRIDDDEMEKTLDALIQIFNAALYNGNINPNDLSLLKEGRHLEWLGNYCLNTRQDIREFWRLFPRYDDEEWNYRALLLNAFLYQSWKKAKSPKKSEEYYPHRPMSYGIKVLLPCLLADRRDLIGEELLEMKRFLNIGNTERHFWMAIRSLAYRLQDSADEWSKFGSGYVKVEGSVLIKWENPLSWFCHFMYRPNNGKALYADILIALARLGDVLREGLDCDPLKLQNIFDLFIQDRVWYLHSPTQLKSIKNVKALNTPITWFPSSPTQQKSADHNISTLENNEPKNSIALEMKKWIDDMKNFKSEKILPPPIISRIWKRFIDNLEYIRSDIETETKENNGVDNDVDNDVDLVDILKCWVKTFLNASLIEEVIFWRGFTEHKINIENVRLYTNNDVFFGNLNKLNPDFNHIHYTKAWINCPLFLSFLEDMPAEIRQKITETNVTQPVKKIKPKKTTPPSK